MLIRFDLQIACRVVLAACLAGTGAAALAAEASTDESLTPKAPLPPPGFMQGCLALIEQERYAEARALLAPVVADHPGWAKAHFYLALTYHKQKRYEAARELFQRTLELDPQYDTPRIYYGWCLYYLGRLTESRTIFQSYLAAKPGDPDAIFALGLIDFDDDEIDSARSRFLETIRLARQQEDNPTEAKARARLADCHLRFGELSQARRELESSIALNPANYEPYFKLSRVLQRLGDPEGAERARRKHDDLRARSRRRQAPAPQPDP